MTEHESWYTHEARKLLFTEKYFSGSHYYFFELKEAKNGSKYIVLVQRKKIGDEFVGVKIRIFEDEMLEIERILHKLIQLAFNSPSSPSSPSSPTSTVEINPNLSLDDSSLVPAFFHTLSSTHNWKEFEKHTYYLLKILGIPIIYPFFDEPQAGKADGFFKVGNLAVIYDCTLDQGNFEQNKSEQINNYCNRLSQGSITISGTNTEEFYHHHKQVWIITQRATRAIKTVNSIEVKEIAIQDVMKVYQKRLITTSSNELSLETQLRYL